MAPDEEVRARALPKARRGHMPEVAWIDGGALEVQHVVVFGNQVQVPAASRHSYELGDHLIRVRDGMKHVAAYGEVEAAVCGLQLVNALMLEPQPWRELC